MIDPVAAHDIANAALLSGGIVFAGVAYAILYAFAEQRRSRALAAAAHGAYGLLVVCTLATARVLNLDGHWVLLVVALLAGYLYAPRWIWRLSVAVHDTPERESDP